MWWMYLCFVNSYVASKIETKEKMEGNIVRTLNNSFSNHWLKVGLNLSSDGVINCKVTTFFKERNPQFDV